MGKKIYCFKQWTFFQCAKHCPAEKWRTCLRSNVWRAGTVITVSRYDNSLTNFHSMIDKYQTGVFSATCDSPTDAIGVCLNVDDMRKRFVTTSSFLIAALAYSWWFFEVFSVSTVNIFFVSERNCANITGWIFFGNCFEWLSFVWQFAALSFETWRFLSTNILQVTRLRFGGIFCHHCTTNLLLSLSVQEFRKSISIW